MVNLTEQEKTQHLTQQQAHLKAATDARVYMNECIALSRAVIDETHRLQPTIPLSGPAVGHYSFDFAQQVHYPSDPHQPGPIYFKTPRKCGQFGVHCEPLGRKVNFIIDEAASCGKGANATVSYLHYFLEQYSFGEKKLILHADNCGGQNKNNIMMQYLAWRVVTGRNTVVELNFLMAGHTKFSPDFGFGLLKKKYRKTKVSSLTDIVEVVEKSAITNVTQLVGSQSGQVLVPVFDWATFFSNMSKTIPQLKRSHQFTFDQSTPGKCTVKAFCNSMESSQHVVFPDTSLIDGMPAKIHPDGLSLARQQYLYKEIREFCTLGTEDLVCPKPIIPEAASGEDEEQPGPSTRPMPKKRVRKQ